MQKCGFALTVLDLKSNGIANIGNWWLDPVFQYLTWWNFFCRYISGNGDGYVHHIHPVFYHCAVHLPQGFIYPNATVDEGVGLQVPGTCHVYERGLQCGRTEKHKGNGLICICFIGLTIHHVQSPIVVSPCSIFYFTASYQVATVVHFFTGSRPKLENHSINVGQTAC